ncbi:uncharacterized protein L969DRAFT_94734 [Mixia osmundae IAM 14324]|uniref:Winged helix DNA-binding domain-containing protein n=1 Tax=Mixia osmundae (strain CBS 9802 / IAM 14324 / JCM 22182 / KY 12970) TaxID=764103 RepID=G7E432_MIXOS|nr:uncharacterized protein L969DRAFT_94734 [Mixia osmundae IAM 14324]KEI39686.1 hypothetical protein L969DRAFT_94734 [Mixia osmundae IAM 14324]GAA97592.1 hypothetical protein E5Q_04270 [Mixia osmundae IAM 14324]
MRRNVGISSLQRHTDSLTSYTSLSSDITAAQTDILSAQLSTFQSTLRNFATQHRAKILSDPVFRQHFSEMCAQLGVDPLGAPVPASGRSRTAGIWDMLGISDWTYALAVQIVDVCLASRDRNGGLIELSELMRGIAKLRTGAEPAIAAAPSANGDDSSIWGRWTRKVTHASPSPTAMITESDIIRALRVLEPLGTGYHLLTIGDRKLVRSRPAEFNTDAIKLVEIASLSGNGFVSHAFLESQARWTPQKVESALETALMIDGLVWIDTQTDDGRPLYWVAALFDSEASSTHSTQLWLEIMLLQMHRSLVRALVLLSACFITGQALPVNQEAAFVKGTTHYVLSLHGDNDSGAHVEFALAFDPVGKYYGALMFDFDNSLQGGARPDQHGQISAVSYYSDWTFFTAAASGPYSASLRLYHSKTGVIDSWHFFGANSNVQGNPVTSSALTYKDNNAIIPQV